MFHQEIRKTLKFAVPLMLSEIVYALGGFIATWMVAQLGKDYLAANALVWNIYFAIMLLLIGILCANTAIISISFGAKDNHTIGVCFKQGLITTALATIPFTIILWFVPSFLILIKQDPIVVGLATTFIKSLIWVVFPMGIIVTIEQFLIGINKTKLVTAVSLLLLPIQTFFSYVLLFGKFGFPQLRLAGIGYGIVIGHVIITVFLLCYLLFSKQFKCYNLFNKFWIVNKKILWELCRTGVPIGAMWFLEVAMFAVMAMLIGKISVLDLAAYQISYQYNMLALSFIFALSQTTTVRIGNEVGANNKKTLKTIFLINMGIGISIMLIFGCFFLFFSKIAIGIDLNLNNPDTNKLVDRAALFLSFGTISIFAEALRMVSQGALRGMKDTRFAMTSSLTACWLITIPLCYVLAFKLNFGSVGVLSGLIIGMSLSGSIMTTRFFKLVKRTDLKTLITTA